MTLRVATANVNGVRAARRKGMDAWLASCGADVVCLQEVRAPADVLAEAFPGWRLAQDPSAILGRAGVAILSRVPLAETISGLPGVREGQPAHTGRWVEATIEMALGAVRIVSVYVHSGRAGTPSMDDKYEFLDAMTSRMDALSVDGAMTVVAGDVNIAHTRNDIKNWRGNLASAGFLPEERAYLDRWRESGWVDVHRELVGDREGPYTWWSSRGRAFDRDTGWRLDYQWATPSLARAARSARVDRAASWGARWSDHAPLVVEYG